MSLTNLQLNWLRTFESVGRHLSFSAAAVELNMSQSAVSQPAFFKVVVASTV